ncbi:hypothetical protein Q5762_09390 [Streptomyces sp. P9(2023)]|uniref:hypothetical protein n=1 Tax=Streptomyces sp. P9(2023) TaxID=3064394 RepID=UPI0028F41304|nr:hypothetical protein [Streptomyces sp. P9(2023)]MDT9688561.1 hypothetical protein [Streptomyces sp. P9(2023)]
MGKTAWKRAGVSLVAVAVVAGVAGCQDGDGGRKAADAPAKPQLQTHEAVTKVIQAAYEKTSAAKSAKLKMTMTMPAGLGDGGTVEITGVQSWNPGAMDITMDGSVLKAGAPDAPEQMRMIMLDNVMYVDMGTERAAGMDGKRWMKLDMSAAAKSGDEELQKSMSNSFGQMNQDPAQQLALLLESPNLKHVGPEKINGVETQRYKGTLSVEQMLDANKAKSAVLSEKERKELLAKVEKVGLKGYDTEVWVDADGYPSRMAVGMTMGMGTVQLRVDYTDYSAKVAVQAPPAKDTFDLAEMLKGIGGGAGQA